MFIKLPKTDWEKDCKVEEYILRLANREVRRVVKELRDLQITKEEIYSLFEGVEDGGNPRQRCARQRNH